MSPRSLITLCVLTTLAVPQALFAFNPHLLATDADLLDVYSTSKNDLALLLSRGALSAYVGSDVTGVSKSASDIVWEASEAFGVNPRFLLALLQREQSLVEDPAPTDDQLNWAMGYAVCDTCAKDDPAIQKYKGFGNQVYYAAKRIRESYLTDLETRGFTESGIGPGREVVIDGVPVIPANKATAVLYTYTPHLRGNENFVRIWDRWFNRRHVDGTLLQDRQTGGIWLIQNGLRRPITSRTAFFSRFNPAHVVAASVETIEDYPIGIPIRFPNYSLLRSPRGTVYLIVDDTRRGFTTPEALRAYGFKTDEMVDVTWDDLNSYVEGEPITTQTLYPQGTLLQNRSTGGVYFVQNGVKQPIMSREILLARFPSPTILPVAPTDLEAYATGDSLPFPDGTLIGAAGAPDVFVVSHGMRRHITDEATFVALGWKFNQIVWTNERSVFLHPLGEPISTQLMDNEVFVAVSP